MQSYSPKRPFEVCSFKNDLNPDRMDALLIYRLKGIFAGKPIFGATFDEGIMYSILFICPIFS